MATEDRLDDSRVFEAPPDPNGVFQALVEEKEGRSSVSANIDTSNVSQIPDKFQGKSPEELVRMYQELESTLGRQGTELGELRRLADDFIKAPVAQSGTTTQPQIQYPQIDINDLSEPEKIQALLQQTVLPIQHELLEYRKEKMETKLKESHPDYVDVVRNPEFQKWVMGSDIRKEMFIRSDKQYDYSAANELFSTWKAMHPSSVSSVQPTRDTTNVDNAFLAGRMDSGRVTDVAAKPKYRRADIVALKQFHPQKYAQLSDMIMEAYAEGRVV